MQTVYVRPATNADSKLMLVRQPDRGWMPLPPDGEWVLLDEYWARRLRDGDVVEAEPPPVEDDASAPALSALPEPAPTESNSPPESPSDAAARPARRA
jgi:hypothetical protein